MQRFHSVIALAAIVLALAVIALVVRILAVTALIVVARSKCYAWDRPGALCVNRIQTETDP